MYAGRIVEEAESERLFAQPRHPYTKTLLNSVLTPDPALGLPEAVIDGGYPSPTAIKSGCSFHPTCPAAAQIGQTRAPILVGAGGVRSACTLHMGAPSPASPRSPPHQLTT